MTLPRRSPSLVLVLSLAIGCSESPTEPALGAPATVVISGSPGIVAVGDTARLSARVVDASGRALADTVLRWRSLAPDVARVDAAGRVDGWDAGVARIVAEAGAASDTVTVAVEVVPVALEIGVRFGLTPIGDSATVGSALTLVAIARDGRGRPMAVAGTATFAVDDTVLAEPPQRRSTLVAQSMARLAGTVTYSASLGSLRATRTLKLALFDTRVGGLALHDVALGASHGCGLDAGGAAQCWGYDNLGTLGRGSRVFGWSASGPVVGAPALSSIAAGGSATCGLTPQRELWCWGGAAPPGRSAVPVRVLEGTEVSAVSVGYSNNTDLTQAGTLVCALTTAGAPWCWGHLVGRVPLQLADTRRFMAIRTARGSDGCGMLGAGQPDAGRIACWTDIRSPAVVIAGDYGTFTSWEVGIDGGCGLDAAGEAWCWRRDGAVATRAAGGLRFSALAVAASLTCGLTTSGAEMICWGQHPRLYYALPGLVRAARDDRFTGLVRSETGVCGWRANASLACFGFGILAVDQP